MIILSSSKVSITISAFPKTSITVVISRIIITPITSQTDDQLSKVSKVSKAEDGEVVFGSLRYFFKREKAVSGSEGGYKCGHVHVPVHVHVHL